MSSNESSLPKKRQTIAQKRKIEKDKKERDLLKLQDTEVSLYESQLKKKEKTLL